MPDNVEPESLPQQGERPDEALARVAGMRLAFSAPTNSLIEEQAKVYGQFIFGEAPALGEGGKRSADEKKMGRGWSLASLPLHGMLRQVLLPTLLSREPTWINRARIGGDDIEKGRGKLYEELAKVIYRESDVHREAACAIDDAMLKRCGWFLVDYDSKKRLPRIRWVDAKNVLTDRENGHSPFPRDQRWWAEFRTISIKDAEYYAKTQWGADKDYEFTPLTTDIDDDDRVQLDGTELLGPDGSPLQRVNERPTEFVRLVYVYVKGANPYGMAASNKAKPGDIVEKGGTDAMYHGKDEVLVLECIGDKDDAKGYKFVGRKDFPFPCDPGECPAEPLRVTMDNRDFYPASIYQPGHSLQVAANWALRYYNTDIHNSARRIVLYADGTVDEKALQKGLWGEDNLVTLKTKGGRVPEQWFRVVGFGEPNPALKEAIPANVQQYRDAVGLDKLDMEARSNRTATDAAILNQGAQVRIGFMADQVEYALANVMRKALQCARWNMSAEDVAYWVGPELLEFYDVKLTKTETDFGGETEYEVPTGEVVKVSDLWNEEVRDPAAIRDEIGIDVEPRSVRFVDPQAEMQDIQVLVNKQMEFHKRISEAQTPQEKMVIARAGNAALKMLADRMHLPNSHELLYDLNDVMGIPMGAEQVGAQAQMMGAMQPGAGPQGPETPQAEGAAGRITASLGMANPLAE
ncbi:MAG: hypothetical protein IPP14_15730 [Planctomycetes bacterium]|nr:hypothetical protein [Planctomycetota bacterium]